MRKLFVLLLCVTCLASSQAFAVSKELLTIGTSQEFETGNRDIAQMAATGWAYAMGVRALINLTPDGKWVGLLAKELPTLENGLAEFYEEGGEKKFKATYELKDDLYWGDGTPVMAEDVEFTWQVGLSETVSVPDREVYELIGRIEIDPENPKKFTIYYAKTRWDYYMQHAQMFILPKHLEGPVFEEHGKDLEGYDHNTLYVTDPTNPGLYCGSYRVSEVELGSHVAFVPNEHWKGQQPYFEKIIIKVIQDTQALEANLLSGTIDMIGVIGIGLDQALALDKRLKEDPNSPYQVTFVPGSVYEHIDVQQTNPILQDIKVRKALVHAIDRDQLSQALFEGKQPKAIHNVAPFDPWYTDDPEKVVLYEYSPREARKLLDEAGWILGDDGYRYKDGEKLSLQLMTTAGNKTRELVEAWLQEEWKKVGVEITIKNEPARVYFGETVRKGAYPALAMYAWISAPESEQTSTFHTKSIPSEENGWNGQNSMHWSNAEVDRLLDELMGEFSHEKRVDLVSKILYHYTNDVPVIPLYYRANISVEPKILTGYQMSPHQYYETNYVESWGLKE